MNKAAPLLFDVRQLRRQRLRRLGGFDEHDFLFREAAQRLADRLLDVTRDFSLGVDLSWRGGILERALEKTGKVSRLVGLDLDPRLLDCQGVASDPDYLPLAPVSADLIAGCLCLHWINDLPGLLAQARQALKPGGLFLASMLGGATLFELRQSFLEAESEISGGAAPRVIPMADIRDLGGLLQRAGFEQPVADCETVVASYADPLSLLGDLRAMGEANALIQRSKRPLTRGLLMTMAAKYQERFQDGQGRIPARFDILTLTGWAAA